MAILNNIKVDSKTKYFIYQIVCVPNGFLVLKSVYLDTKSMSLLHIVTKITKFEEMVGHFCVILKNGRYSHQGGDADLGSYIIIISR